MSEKNTEESTALAMARQLGIPYASEANRILKTSPEALALVPAGYARVNSVLPLFLDGRVLAVAVADPEDVLLIDELKTMTKLAIQPFVATKTAIGRALEAHYP